MLRTQALFTICSIASAVDPQEQDDCCISAHHVHIQGKKRKKEMLTLETLVPFIKNANNEQKIFFLKNIYLCIYFGCTGSLLLLGLFSSCGKGEKGLLSSRGTWASHCGPSLVTEHGL